MYYVDGEILDIILLEKIMNEDGHSWILGYGQFKIISTFDSQVESFIVVLTNNSFTSTIQLFMLSNVKIEPSEDTDLLLSDFGDNICHVVDIVDTSSFL